jgi:parallel beta-helix repeat protein
LKKQWVLSAAVLLLVSLSLALPGYAKVVYVRTDGNDANDGSTWELAKKTVQAGLDAASGGTSDEVWVAAGTYVERITLKLGVKLYGGFAGSETSLDQRPAFPRPAHDPNETVLDGAQAGSVVTSPTGATATTRIDGFTIRNGKASKGGGIYCSSSSPTISNNTISANSGGGIYCSYSSPTISNNTISANSATGFGGGICCFNSSPTISDNTISASSATSSGGGIYCSKGSPTISNNTISGNGATYSGGGIDCSYSSPTISNNTISGNRADSDGGGICCSYSSPAISNNTISGNRATRHGGGISCSNSSPTISSNTVSGNSATYDGGGIYCYNSSPAISNNTISANGAGEGGGIYCEGSSPTISNNVVAFNSSGLYRSGGTPTLWNNCVYNPDGYNYSGLSPGTGDISADPKLADLRYGNVHIQTDSPCRDAGDNSIVQSGWTDMDGQARIQPAGGTVDIGADESDGTTWPTGPYVIVRVSPGGNDANDGSSWAFAKRSVQAGIDAASEQGGEVWVASGTYNERIVLRPYAYVYGGFAGRESTRDERDWVLNRTILDGNAGGSVVTAVGHRVSAIDGFTIRNGAGGIYCKYSSPAISNNIITGNSGRGIDCRYSSSTISSNTISANGRGISCSNSSPTISNNTISGNSANYGGGIYCYNSSPTISNNIVAFNSSGLYRSGGTPTLWNNCVYNPDGYNYSGLSPGTGDISADPELADSRYGNLHIQPDSPCRDAGDNSAVQPGWKDMDGQDRIQPAGGTVDIGADESDGTTWPTGPYVIVRVSPDGNDANDGSSWALAKRSVQAGMDAASEEGGEVWVASGTYNERIVLRPYAYVYGGFAGSESVRDERDWVLNRTILDGNAGGSVVTATGVGYRLSAIDGFTIRNGAASDYGGGVYCSWSSPTISNNTISANMAGYYGGGVYCAWCSPAISNNTISGNRAESYGGGGGGIECWYCSPTISSNTISDNTADHGGGIDCYHSSSPMISNNTISGNSTTYDGGGINCSYSSPAISNNTISANSASKAGGIFCSDSSPTISNNTLSANSASDGGGIYFQGSSSPTVCNNIVAFNSSGLHNYGGAPVVLRNNCVYNPDGYNYSRLSPGTGDISADPMFVDRPGGDYHLRVVSPCINAGWNDAPGLPSIDTDGEGRICLGTVDIGADEFWPAALNIADGKKQADGGTFGCAAAVVSAVFEDCLYTEANDRSSGMRVEKPGHALAVGMRADVWGVVRTNADGERYIEASAAVQNGAGTVEPVGMTNKTLGGTDWNYDPVTGAGQRGVEDGVGLNNIGLLARTTGVVTAAGDDFFYIDDGTHARDASVFNGVRVRCDSLTKPEAGQHVFVTSISTIKNIGGRFFRSIRPRVQTDIQILQ